MSAPLLDATVYIVDDDAAVRDSLTLLLGLRRYATQCFATAEAFLAAVDSKHSGCVLLDLRMPGVDGLAAQAELTARGITMPVVVLTAHGDAASARASLKAGAYDFLEKPADEALLVRTIEAALAAEAEARATADRRATFQWRLTRLTPREREIFDHIVRGRHNREIAVDLAISPRTVEVHKARLMDKLGVERMAEMYRMAMDLGLMPDSPR
ncbi:MAG: response regulator transcription factor [Casimicrobiaceae bacterium]